MSDIQQILVPTDFHRHTDELTNFAVGIANKLGAKIIFLHVVEHFAHIVSLADVTPVSLKQVDEELFSIAQQKMTDLMSRNKEKCLLADGVVLRGGVADSIVEYVKDKQIDLIIMGTHGAQGIEKILLGSVAERVLKRASCPVLIFNPYKGDRGYSLGKPINDTVQPV